MSTLLNILLCNLSSFHRHYSNEKPFRASLITGGNFKVLTSLIYTVSQVDSVQSKLRTYIFEVIKVVGFSESIVSWDLEVLKIIFLVNCDFLHIPCSSLYNVNVEFLQSSLGNLSKKKLKMSHLLSFV